MCGEARRPRQALELRVRALEAGTSGWSCAGRGCLTVVRLSNVGA